MVDLLVGELGAPYVARWSSLKADSQPWANGETAQDFIRGALHPLLAKELYNSNSKVLVEGATKSLVRADDWASDGPRRRPPEGEPKLRAKGGAEAVTAAEGHATALEGEVARLKAKLEESWSHIRLLDDELLSISQDIEAAKVAARAAEEVLEEECLRLPGRVEEAVAGYKASTGFERGLVRSGQVTYEYEFRVAYARFRVKFPNLDLEPDPFAEEPMD